MTITEYEPAHHPQIIGLMNEFSQYLESSDNTKITSYQEGGAKYFSDKMIALAKKKNGKVFVAVEGDNIIGFVGGYVDSLNEDEKFEVSYKKPGVICELYVSSKFRKKGIGKILLSSMEKHFKNIGCDIVRLSVLSSNEKAREFYYRTGFVDTNIIITKLLK